MKRKDIEEVLRRIGCSSFKYSTDWITTGCPLAPWAHEKGTDKHPSFGVHEARGMSAVHCFSCGFSGGLASLVREYGRYAIKDNKISAEEIDQLIDFVLLSEEDTGDIQMKGVQMEQKPVLERKIVEYLNCYHGYYETRGITESMARKWMLGYDPEVKRALFPLIAMDGSRRELVGVIGRTVIDEKPKWKNYPQNMRKCDYLFGEALIPETANKIIVVEGPIDVVLVTAALDEYAMTDYACVGLMGSDPSEAQQEKLISFGSEIICMLDNDASGKAGTLKLTGGSLGALIS